MTQTKIVNVKRYKRSIGRTCMHCGAVATVTAIRKYPRTRLPVRYCEKHAAVIIGRERANVAV